MIIRRLAAAFAIVALLFAIPAIVEAQVQTGRIVGTVSDPDGSPLPGVSVTVSGPNLIQDRVDTTNELGQYRFIALPPGNYGISYQLQGFQGLVREGIRVSVGSATSVNVTLELATVEETITVTGESPLVDVKDTSVGANFDEDMLQKVPSGRDIWNLLEQQAPSVITDRNDVGGNESGLQAVFSARGSSWTQSSQWIDGVNVTDPAAIGAADFYYDYDSFEEIEVSTGAHGPEAQTPGVYINLVTKTGGNEYHGAGQFYLTDGEMQAGNIDDRLRDLGVERGNELDRITDGSVQFGGPFVEGKWTFFGSYRYFDVERFVPGFPEPETTTFPSFLFKTTWQMNDANRLSGMYTVQTYDKPNRNASATVAPEATWVEDDIFNIVQVKWNSVLSDNAFLDVSFSALDIDFPLSFQPDITGQSTIDFATGKTTGAAVLDLFNDRARISSHNSLSYYVPDWHGSHDFKLGFQYDFSPVNTDFDAVDDVLLFKFGGFPLFVLTWNTPVQQETDVRVLSFYADDNWTIGNLTLGLGVRAEFTNGWLPNQESPAGTFAPARSFDRQDDVITWDAIVPRLRATYDVFGNGRTAIKANFARYGHQLSTGTVGFANPNGLSTNFWTWNDLNGDGQFQPGEEGILLAAGGALVSGIDPDFDTPITDEFTVGLDQQIGEDWVASGTFIYRKEDNLQEDVNTGLDFDSDFVPVTVAEPGPDGVFGTGDDGSIQVFNQVSGFGDDFFLLTNVGEKETTYKGVELQLQRRFRDNWNLLASLTIGEVEGLIGTGGFPPGDSGFTSNLFDSPNAQINARGNPFWDRPVIFKVSGSYLLPYDVLFGGVVRSQSGSPLGRIVQLPLNQGVIDVFAEPRGSDRLPTLTTVDLRAGKEFPFSFGRLGVYLDAFNITNENTVTTRIETAPADNFGFPTAILPPRTVRIGARLTF